MSIAGAANLVPLSAVIWARDMGDGTACVHVNLQALSGELVELLTRADVDCLQRDRGRLYIVHRPSGRRAEHAPPRPQIPPLPVLPPLPRVG